jgi:parvulin-like peptidyl-prolyl isomerase
MGSSPPPIQPFPVVAKWDGGVITLPEVRAEVQRLPPSLVEQYKTVEGQRQFVEALLAKRLLAGEARRLGLDQSDEIARQVRELEERLVIQALLDKATRAASEPTDDELRAFYQEHLSDFRTRPRVRVARVLIRPGPDPAAARRKVASLLSRVRRGEPLAKVAAQGEGPERMNAGELGWLADNSPLLPAALALKAVGDASEILETSDGFAILVLRERQEERTQSFEEAKQVVLGRIGPTRQRRVFDELVRRLRRDTQASINTDALR